MGSLIRSVKGLALLGIPVVSASLMMGCGGEATGTNASADQTLVTPGLTAKYTGTLKPAARFSFNGVRGFTTAGASFSAVTLNPAEQIGNTFVAYDLGNQIWTLQPLNPFQSPTPITHNLAIAGPPSFSHNGQIGFPGTAPGTTVSQIYLCNYDGSALRAITSTTVQHLEPSWNYQNTKLVFHDAAGKLYTVGSSGTGEAALASLTGFHPVFSPDGTKIAYYKSSGGHMQIFTSLVAGGGSPVQISTGYTTKECTSPAWSPDGSTIAFTVAGSGIAVADSAGKGGGYLARDEGDSPSFSPDGANLSYQKGVFPHTSLYAAPIAANSQEQLISFANSSTTSPVSPVWSPFPGSKTFIGSGGIVPSATGFLYGQIGDTFASFCAVVATTAAHTSITRQTEGGVRNAIFVIKADSITKLVYTNSYFGALTGLSFSGVSQILMNVSLTSGQINTIAPLAQKRSGSSSPKPTVLNGHVVYDASFSALYNAKGVNVAPNGATHIEIDEKTGDVLSWR